MLPQSQSHRFDLSIRSVSRYCGGGGKRCEAAGRESTDKFPYPDDVAEGMEAGKEEAKRQGKPGK